MRPSTSSLRRSAIAALVALALATGLIACGGGDSTTSDSSSDDDQITTVITGAITADDETLCTDEFSTHFVETITGKKGEALGYRVGGKTGTAEVPGRGGYDKSRNVSTFAAAFPMDRPRYVVIAMMDSPQRVQANSFQTTAAYTAAPVVSRVIQRTGALLGVAPDLTRDVDVSDLLPLLWHAPGEDPSAAE